MKIFFVFLLTINICLGGETSHSVSILHIKGKAFYSSNQGPFGPLAKGDIVSEGDSVKTGDSSLVILRFPDKSTVRVEPNSLIEISSIVERVNNESLGSTSLILKAGRSVINIINKSQAPVFKIKTKTVAIGVRGTYFFAGIDKESNDLDIAVQKGEVEVSKLDDSDQADAVTAGTGLTLENGENFTQPQSYDWIKKVNFDASDKTVEPNYFLEHLSKKRLEFRQKRKKWQRNRQRWLAKKKLWSDRQGLHKLKEKRLKSERRKLLKERANFLKKKKKLDFKRNGFLKSSGSFRSKVKDLRKDRLSFDKDLADYKKLGKKDPKKEKELLKRRKNLSVRQGSLRKSLKQLKSKKALLSTEVGGLVQDFPVQKTVKKVVKKKVNRTVERRKKREQNKLRKKARKKVKDKVGDFLGF
ncbi:MAG: hypothetical protein ACJAT2_001806 [Bacteriovoracaceae bacterium]|jgi:hypothetical protein